MAIQGAQVDVSTAAVELNAADTDGVAGQRLLIRNLDADELAVHLGPSTVDPGGAAGVKGCRLQFGESLALTLDPGEKLYGRTASGTVTLDVLRVGA